MKNCRFFKDDRCMFYGNDSDGCPPDGHPRHCPNKVYLSLAEIAKAGFDPIMISKILLSRFGLAVYTAGFGYNSLSITVVDPETKEVLYEEMIGR